MNQPIDGASDNSPGTITLIGIGQSLRGDDAAGLAAVHLWQEKYQSNSAHSEVRVELAELPGVGLLSLIEGSSLSILVDAMDGDAKVGTIHILTNDQLESFTPSATSAHGWGVAETLSLGQKLMPAAMPNRLILIGIQAGDFSPGASLSPEVMQALPRVADVIEHFVTSG